MSVSANNIREAARPAPRPPGPGPTPEVELLLCCARVELDDSSSRRVRELIAGGLDWDAALTGALRHGLMPLLHSHLASPSMPPLPPEASARLRDSAQRVAALNVYLSGELRGLLRIFNERRIPAIPYKGPALALEAYGRVGLRQFCDLDVIVRVEDVPAAAEVLRALGYAPYQALGEAQREMMMRRQCNLPFTRDGDRTIVEVHWDVSAPDFGRPVGPDGVWARSRASSFEGQDSRSLAPEDLLLALCVHGSKHRWERLAWVCDIAQLVGKESDLDWGALLERARLTGSRRMLLLGLTLAGELLRAPLPERAREEIASDGAVGKLAARVREELYGGGRGGPGMGGYFGFQLAARERASDKLKYIRYALSPTDEDLSYLDLPRALSFAYYVLRPLRLLWTGGPSSLRRGDHSDPAR